MFKVLFTSIKKHYISYEGSSVLSLFINLFNFYKFLSFFFAKSLKKSKDVKITKALTFSTFISKFFTRSSDSVSRKVSEFKVSN